MTKNTQETFFALVRAGLWSHTDNTESTDIKVSGYRLKVKESAIDWGEILRLAEEQSIIGLIADAIDRFKVSSADFCRDSAEPEQVRSSLAVPKVHDSRFMVPQVWALQFIGQTLQIEQQNKAMNQFLGEMVSKMRRAGIYTLLVKGQGVAQCYERPLWRSCGDIDFFFSEENFKKAQDFLLPMSEHAEEDHGSKHQEMVINSWVVEIHGWLRGGISSRINRVLDEVQTDTFNGGNVRSWDNNGVQIFMLGKENDVFYVFTHFLNHFFKGGVGLRQICDWCRLLWTYRDKIDVALLEKRLRKMDLMSEWKAFAALAVNTLGMPESAMPLYDPASKWSRKAEKILAFVLETGNFGHNRHRERPNSYIAKKAQSLWRHTKDNLRQIAIFPLDSLRVWWGVFTNGLYEAVRGK